MIYEECVTPLADADAGVGELDRLLRMLCNWGHRGWAVWFGPDADRGSAKVRIDADLEHGGVAVRWRLDSTFLKVREPQEADMEVCTSAYAPHSIIPAELLCATLPAARQVLHQYLTTGEKPAGQWHATSVIEYDLAYDENDQSLPLEAAAEARKAVTAALSEGDNDLASGLLREYNIPEPDGQGWRLMIEYPRGSAEPDLLWHRTLYTFPNSTVTVPGSPNRAAIAMPLR